MLNLRKTNYCLYKATDDWLGPMFFEGLHLEFSHLGVILDQRFKWGPQLEKLIDRGE